MNYVRLLEPLGLSAVLDARVIVVVVVIIYIIIHVGYKLVVQGWYFLLPILPVHCTALSGVHSVAS